MKLDGVVTVLLFLGLIAVVLTFLYIAMVMEL